MPFYTDERESLITRCICRIYDLFGFGAPAPVVESMQALANMRGRPLSDDEKAKLADLLQWLNSGGENINYFTLVEQVEKVTEVTFYKPHRTRRAVLR